ncbi:hypothetical protein [Antarcticirhabdus aurantiaca]|uniref:Uncharacterized protein n=1 Tax=Antarcticirhabdus aurantiaca TaxID=2606717 RepID=A0ACD4NKI5_9HYPH|nr:hypothetical protein [Antarcticirhabdus aurantiaca]WAJ27385.1 hypothetical protein OXU80_21440 [Jeongeuplla avenae]
MSTLRTRLRQIEKRVEAESREGRLIVLQDGEPGDDAMVAFLSAQGMARTKADQVVHFRTIYENRDGSDQPCGPMHLLGVTPLASRF